MNQDTKPAPRQSESAWRRYPRLDAALEAETPPVLESCEASRSEIERLSRTGTERERERARTALLAYQRALELYYYLAELRDRGVSKH